MLNGNKSKSSKRRTLFDATFRATHKAVVAGRNKRGERRAANQTLKKEFA